MDPGSDHCQLEFGPLHPFHIMQQGAASAATQSLMRASAIVKGYPRRDASLGLAAVGIAFQVDVLMLQRAPQALYEDVIHPAAAAIHRDFDLVSLEDISEGGAGELAALDALLFVKRQFAWR